MNGFTIENINCWDKPQGELPNLVFQEDGVAIVAPGSQPCIYELAHYAKKWHKEACFFPCLLSNRDYSLGLYERKIKSSVLDALQQPYVKKILIYVSCMEIVTGWEWNGVSKDDNPHHIPIEVLFRGPLSSHNLTPRVRYQQILDKWNRDNVFVDDKAMLPNQQEQGMSLCEKISQFDCIEKPAFWHIAKALEDKTCDILLVTPGGCRHSLFIDICKTSGVMKNTRFNRQVVVRGQWDFAVDEILQAFPSNRPLVLLESPVVHAVGIDLERLAGQLTKKGKRTYFVKNAGSLPAL